MIRSETLALVRSRWLTVIVFLLFGVILASAYVAFSPREYSASTRLVVSTSTGSNGSDLAQGGTFAQQQARNYANITTSDAVLQPVITALDLDTTVAALARSVSATIPLATSVISITVTDGSPDRAARVANGVTTSLANTVAGLVPTDAGSRSPVMIDIVQRATVPARPSSPNALVALGAGGLGGAIAGAAYVILTRRLSSRLRTATEVRRIADASILGGVRREDDPRVRGVVTDASSGSLRAEEFRQIRTNVAFLQAGNARKAFVVTSSVPGEGKSTVSSNLAASLASAGRSVCLVEADLRKPSLAGVLDLEGAIGLTTVLSGAADLDDALQPWGASGLQVLLSGERPPNPSELLSSEATADVIQELRERFEVVVIDAPPLLPVTDAAILGNLVGGVILVVGLGKVRERELAGTVETLAVAHTPLLGIVTNFAAEGLSAGGYEAYAYASPPTVRVDIGAGARSRVRADGAERVAAASSPGREG